jgi:hypothetical protein
MASYITNECKKAVLEVICENAEWVDATNGLNIQNFMLHMGNDCLQGQSVLCPPNVRSPPYQVVAFLLSSSSTYSPSFITLLHEDMLISYNTPCQKLYCLAGQATSTDRSRSYIFCGPIASQPNMLVSPLKKYMKEKKYLINGLIFKKKNASESPFPIALGC